MNLPPPEGVHDRVELPQEEFQPWLVRPTATLTTIASEYRLFTHALLFTHGLWSGDPINDYVVEHNPTYVPFLVELPQRLFHGLEFTDKRRRIDSTWCYRLLAIHQDGWVPLFNFMSTVGGIDRDRGNFYRLIAQAMPVPDLVELDKKAVLPVPCPTVEVVTFGLDGNKRAVFFEPARNPPIDKPRVRVTDPDPETRELAVRIFQEEPHPYRPYDVRQATAQLKKATKRRKVLVNV